MTGQTQYDQLAEHGEIRFTVFGIAKPAGSKRAFVRNGRAIVTDDCTNSREWKSEVKDAARAAYSGPPIEGPIELQLVIVRPRVKSHFRANGQIKSNAPHWCITKPDSTKLLRGIEDAITNAGLWRDDSQVCKQAVDRCYGDTPRVEVLIRPL